MTNDPKNQISNIVVPEIPINPHAARARALEAQAGVGLRREYWLENVKTPFGEYSRRALAYSVSGVILTGLFLTGLFVWRISTIPNAPELAETDGFTVMTHVFANFAAPAKDEQFQPYRSEDGLSWRNRDAYSFAWVDANGATQRVVIASYANPDDLVADYRDRTNLTVTTDRTGSFAYGNKINVEARALKNYGAQWIALRMSNLLLLITPTASEQDIQALQSHFVTIVGSAYREFIPSATP